MQSHFDQCDEDMYMIQAAQRMIFGNKSKTAQALKENQNGNQNSQKHANANPGDIQSLLDENRRLKRTLKERFEEEFE